jgi:hypothetical protein
LILGQRKVVTTRREFIALLAAQQLRRVPRAIEGESAMPTYVMLANFTDQGIRKFSARCPKASGTSTAVRGRPRPAASYYEVC